MTRSRGELFKGLLTASRLMDELCLDPNYKMLSNNTRRTIAFCKANMPDMKKLHEIREHSPLLQGKEYCQGKTV